jgi:RNA 3'-terminal phosphate cyclase (ATP)
MLTIDGSHGEGGGQIVRSSLALSLVTGQAVTIHNIRAGRSKPGLMRQHVTAVQAARKVSDAKVSGAEIGSFQLVFKPHRVRAGDYTFRIGTAGSTTLVLQTVLPALMIAEGVSTVTLHGGTHNPFAPPSDFLERVFLPLLARMGPRVTMRLVRPGFFPAGGGQLQATIQPAGLLTPFDLLERGDFKKQRVRALVANLPQHIAQRENETIAGRTGWPPSCFLIEQAPASPGPGNVVMIELESEHVTELFTGFGQRGVRAEQVAGTAADAALRYIDSGVPVGEHLADQLMLPLGIGAWQGRGGGTFRTAAPSAHAMTHIEVLRAFLDIRIDTKEVDAGLWEIRVGR